METCKVSSCRHKHDKYLKELPVPRRLEQANSFFNRAQSEDQNKIETEKLPKSGPGSPPEGGGQGFAPLVNGLQILIGDDA